MTNAQQHLIFDADDTLWASNRLFEEVTSAFIDWLAHPKLEPTEVRGVLDDVARVTNNVHGTSAKTYARGLEMTYRLLTSEASASDLAHIEGLAGRLSWREPMLMDGVDETLAALSARHDLIVLTRGDNGEQHSKMGYSGLAGHFRATVVVPDKDVDTYRAVLDEYELDPAVTWMIGNSPRYDILPALEAGLRAVHIPSEHTWSLEDAALPDRSDGRLLRLRSFTELLAHF